jgi:hypothetical protein
MSLQLTSVIDGPTWKRLLEYNDTQNVKQGGTFEVGAGRVVLRAPNGTRYSLVVSNTGVLSTVAVTN